MERLERKRISGHDYYYYSRWEWREGRCRRVWQQYLGPLAKIAAALAGPTHPLCAEVFEYGLSMGLWQVAEAHQLIATIDRLCPKRHQGLSVGEYLTLAALNRASDPVSKRGMWNWFRHTALRRCFPTATREALRSQRFWDHMDGLDQPTLDQVWSELLGEVLARAAIDLSQVSYDGTNFYTFISTFNTRSELAKRGKNKQGRSNLRQVSYALFCTRDGQVPLFYDVYEGNRNDCPEFAAAVAAFHRFLVTHHLATAPAAAPVTLIFDKGNNSAANIALLDQLGLGFIGSLKLGEHPELAATSNQDKRFLPCRRPGLDTFKYFEVQKEVYGHERRVLVCFNQELFAQQYQTLQHDLAKATAELAALQQRLADRQAGVIRGGQAPTVDSVQKQAASCRSRPYLKDLLPVTVSAGPLLSYHLDQAQLTVVADTVLGKKLVVTGREWDAEEVIEAYHSQYVIEHLFHSMKDRDYGIWWPQHHYTDQKVRVHGFYCTLAVLVRSLLWRRVRQGGLQVGLGRLLHELAGIREVVNFYPSRRGRQPTTTVLTRLDEVQQRLVEVLGLEPQPDRLG